MAVGSYQITTFYKLQIAIGSNWNCYNSRIEKAKPSFPKYHIFRQSIDWINRLINQSWWAWNCSSWHILNIASYSEPSTNELPSTSIPCTVSSTSTPILTTSTESKYTKLKINIFIFLLYSVFVIKWNKWAKLSWVWFILLVHHIHLGRRWPLKISWKTISIFLLFKFPL